MKELKDINGDVNLIIYNTIFIKGEINEDSADEFSKSILYISYQNKDPINIFIHSDGGLVDAGFQIINMMRFVPNVCRTICIGESMSMGAYIFAAGQKGKRYILPLSRLMIHQVQYETEGSLPEMEGQITKLREDNEILLKDFAKNIGKSLREIKKKTEHDYYLNAQEAVDFGIADKIIRRLSEIQ